MTWRREGITGGLLVLSASLFGISIVAAQAQTPLDVVPFSWFGLTGILALFAAGINWGSHRAALIKVEKELEILRDVAHSIVPRQEIDSRLARMEAKIDTLIISIPTKQQR